VVHGLPVEVSMHTAAAVKWARGVQRTCLLPPNPLEISPLLPIPGQASSLRLLPPNAKALEAVAAALVALAVLELPLLLLLLLLLRPRVVMYVAAVDYRCHCQLVMWVTSRPRVALPWVGAADAAVVPQRRGLQELALSTAPTALLAPVVLRMVLLPCRMTRNRRKA
jgi:hypothetical protein